MQIFNSRSYQIAGPVVSVNSADWVFADGQTVDDGEEEVVVEVTVVSERL